jgi:transcriptional regulator with XRE-family HTH domain
VSSPVSPRIAREERRRSAARRLARLLAEHDVTQAELADACGVGYQRVQKWSDRDRTDTPSVADLEAMPTPIARGFLEHVAESHGLVITEAVAPDATHTDDLRTLADAIRESGEAAAIYADAMADGGLSIEEAHAVIREATQAVDAFTRMRQRAEVVARLPKMAPIRRNL